MSGPFAFHELLLRHARETADVYVVEQASPTDPPGALHVFARTRTWRYDPAGVAFALGRRRDPDQGGGTRPLDRASAADAVRRLGAELPDDGFSVLEGFRGAEFCDDGAEGGFVG